MDIPHTRRRYHHLIPILYHSNMLTPEQLAMIPSSTRSRWDGYRHDDYFGFEMVKDYIDSFDYIQQVLVSKHIKQGLMYMCALRTGYKSIISEIEGNKKMMRNHADKITFAIHSNGNVRLVTTKIEIFEAISAKDQINSCFFL